MRGREQEIRKVARELDGLLDDLRDTVAQLTAILVPPLDGQAPAPAEVTPA